MRYLFIILFILTGCGSDKLIEKPDFYWNEKLEFFYYEFIDDAEQHGVKELLLPSDTVQLMDFGNIKERYEGLVDRSFDTTLGICAEFDQVTYKVAIKSRNTEYWREILVIPEVANWDYLDQKQLMYHEFGHCFLNKEHSKDPCSIMYPQQFSCVIDWDIALEQFFTIDGVETE